MGATCSISRRPEGSLSDSPATSGPTPPPKTPEPEAREPRATSSALFPQKPSGEEDARRAADRPAQRRPFAASCSGRWRHFAATSRRCSPSWATPPRNQSQANEFPGQTQQNLDSAELDPERMAQMGLKHRPRENFPFLPTVHNTMWPSRAEQTLHEIVRLRSRRPTRINQSPTKFDSARTKARPIEASPRGEEVITAQAAKVR